MASGSSSAGAHYSSLILDQLENERSLKASLEQRAVTVVTTAGTLVTLLFALGALVTKDQSYDPPPASVALLLMALIGFLGSAVAAIETIKVRRYEEVKIEALRRLLTERFWKGEASTGERRTAEVRVNVLAAARKQNARKATSLKWAMRLEVIAVALVSASVAVILLADNALWPLLVALAVTLFGGLIFWWQRGTASNDQ